MKTPMKRAGAARTTDPCSQGSNRGSWRSVVSTATLVAVMTPPILFGCEAEPPSNVFDPETHPEMHQEASLMGRIELEGSGDPRCEPRRAGADDILYCARVTVEGTDLWGQPAPVRQDDADRDGIFEVSALDPGRYTVRYEALYHKPDGRQEIEVDFGRKRVMAPIKLLRQRVRVHGQVFVEDGPVRRAAPPGVTVQLVTQAGLDRLGDPDAPSGQGELPDFIPGVTDATGGFVIEYVPAGRQYTVIAHHPDYLADSTKVFIEPPERMAPIELVLRPTHARIALNEGRGYTNKPTVRLSVYDPANEFDGSEDLFIEPLDHTGGERPACGPSQTYDARDFAPNDEHEPPPPCESTRFGEITARAHCHHLTLGADHPESADPCFDIARGEHRFRVDVFDRFGSMTELGEASIVFDDVPISPDAITLTPPGSPPLARWDEARRWIYLREYTDTGGGTLTLDVDAFDLDPFGSGSPRHTFTGCLKAGRAADVGHLCESEDEFALLPHRVRVDIPAVRVPDMNSPSEPTAGEAFIFRVHLRDGALNPTRLGFGVCADADAPDVPGWYLHRRMGDERVVLPTPAADRGRHVYVTGGREIDFEFFAPPEDDNPCARAELALSGQGSDSPALPRARGRDLASITIQDPIVESNRRVWPVPATGPIPILPWTLTGDGTEHRLLLEFEDMAGNVTEREILVRLDTRPPVAPVVTPRHVPLEEGPLSAFAGVTREHGGVYWTPHPRELLFDASTGDTDDNAEPATRLMIFTSRGHRFDATGRFHEADGIRITVDWDPPLPEGRTEIWGEFRDIAGNVALTPRVVLMVDTTPPSAHARMLDGHAIGPWSPPFTLVSTNAVQLAITLEDEPTPERVKIAVARRDLTVNCYQGGNAGREEALFGCAVGSRRFAEMRCIGEPVAPSYQNADWFQPHHTVVIPGEDTALCLQAYLWDLVGNMTPVEDVLHVQLDRVPPAEPLVDDLGQPPVADGMEEPWKRHLLRIRPGVGHLFDLPVQYLITLEWQNIDLEEENWLRLHFEDYRFDVTAVRKIADCSPQDKVCATVTHELIDVQLTVNPSFYHHYRNGSGRLRIAVRAGDRAGNVSDQAVLTCPVGEAGRCRVR